MKKVSIIIPVYNVLEYLDECVQSAINQTYSNLEIILVDDGATDGSANKCNDWSEKDERIKVVHKSNGGLSDARNAGLDNATGEYIFFLDGDDYIRADLLERTIPYFEQGFDLVSFQYTKEWSDGKKEATAFKAQVFVIYGEEEKLLFLSSQLLQYKFGWEAWSRVFRRDIIEKYNIRFADNKKIFAEDIYFNMCYCSCMQKMIALPDHLYIYRQRDGSIMQKQSAVLNAGRMNELCKELLAFYYSCNNQILIEHFSVLYHFILDNVITRYQRANALSPTEMRTLLQKDVSDYNFLKTHFNKLGKERRYLYRVYCDGRYVEHVVNTSKYYCDGNVFRFRACHLSAAVISRCLNMNRLYNDSDINIICKFAKNRRKCFLIGTEDFGNIGDHAIAEAQLAFLNNYLNGYSVMEITASEYNKKYRYLEKYIGKDDIILLTGGGNFGDEYSFAQDIKDSVCSKWIDNIKIIFPQTVFFTGTKKGKERLDCAKKIYTQSSNVYFFTREKKSFEIAKNMFSCDVFCIPDIVLSGNPIGYPEIKRTGILLCQRSDKEKKLLDSEQEILFKSLQKHQRSIRRTDLQLESSIAKESRRFFIEEKMREFCGAELVITDRLHGMVFAALTGTPCIVFSNYNHKVKGTYDWISYLPYIRYAETVEDAKRFIPELLAMKDCKFDNRPLLPHFEKLIEVIRNHAAN